jgi:carboxypeptidase C (cathepsin A)
MRRFCILAVVSSSLFAIAARAQEHKPQPPAHSEQPTKEEQVVSEHSLKIGDRSIGYRATAGMMPLKEEDGKVTANIFYIAYTQNGANASKRPITFAFNGGPGSSSVWLHMGAFGPKRIGMTDEGLPLQPPGKLVDNDLSLLDLTDLVFIDPVSTGYSRPAPGQDAKKFHGVQGDLDSVGEFIRLYTSRNKRWDSPKFLAGESYGTTRASALVGHMQDKLGMNFNGVILISAILNFQTARFEEGNDLPPVLFLPTFAATAWYHDRIGTKSKPSLAEYVADAEKFAGGEYATALMKGDRLPEAEQKQIAQKVASFTGLTEGYVLRSNLRVEIQRFTKELLREDRRTVGRYDSRMKGIDVDAAGERGEYDPSYATVQGAFTSGFNEYVRGDLKFETDVPYEILTGRVQPWDFGDARNRYLNVAPILRGAMTKNRNLRVFLACGYYDMATPFYAAEYTFDHMRLDPELRSHVTTAYYEAGHMMYVHRPSHEKLKKDLAAFYGQVLKP